MKFKDYFSLKHALFAILLFAILIPFAIRDSNNQVKVSFDDTNVYTSSNKYNLTVPYDLVDRVDLAALPEPGEKMADGYDDDILRAGMWKNDIWGEYHITADLDASNCVVMHLKDGRIFVFSCKNNTATEEAYNTLLNHLN